MRIVNKKEKKGSGISVAEEQNGDSQVPDWVTNYSTRLVQTTIWIPEDMRKQLRIATVEDDTTVSKIARQYFHDYLTSRHPLN